MRERDIEDSTYPREDWSLGSIQGPEAVP